MFLKIMVAIDGSKTSTEALLEAKRMALAHQGTLRIVYAASDVDEADRKTGHKLLTQAKSELGEGVPVDTRILQAESMYGLNGIAETIAAAANEWGADLVVMGSSHRQGLKRLVIGSVAEQLIPKVNASILLVRPR